MRTLVSIGSGCGICAIKPVAAKRITAHRDNNFFIVVEILLFFLICQNYTY